MKREEILKRQEFSVGAMKKKRVLIISDIKTEADDPFAIVQHLLSQTEDVCGIVATHFEWKYTVAKQWERLKGTSMMQCYEEGEKLLSLMDIDDVPLFKGSVYPLWMQDEIAGQQSGKESVHIVNRSADGEEQTLLLPESEGADFIIREAMKETEEPLYVACLGALTDLALALCKAPEIAKRMTAIIIGGGAYPHGGSEPNFRQDPIAADMIFGSGMNIWQIPMNVYPTMEVSLAELREKVKPCGEVGAYLWNRIKEVNDFYAQVPMRMDFPHGESWSLGDNPSVVVLLQNAGNTSCWHMRKAPRIHADCTYEENSQGTEIRVYDSVDVRLGMEDMFAKIKLCYGE